jgi:hypothetical protein
MGEKENARVGFFLYNLMGRDKDLGFDAMLILKWILQDIRWSDVNWTDVVQGMGHV